MSLLDQLSSLCNHSTTSNYQPSFLSFNLDHSFSHAPSLSLNQPIYSQKHEPSSETKKSQPQNSQQQMIKLFDDEQLKPTWRLIKTYKKPNSQQIIQTTQQKNLSQFTVDNPKKDSQTILTKFTKVFHLFNTKLIKLNYEFFIKLQKYSKAVLKQKALKQQEMRKMKLASIEKGFQKLTQTLKIISLKYFQPQSQQLSSFNVQNQKNQAFIKIKSVYSLGKNLSSIEKCIRKSVYRNFFIRFQQRNKTAIKIDLFTALLETILKKKYQQNVVVFLNFLKQHQAFNKEHINFNSQELIPKYQKERQQQYYAAQKLHWIHTNYSVQLRQSFPLGFFIEKAANPGFQFQAQLNLQILDPQNIPLKLHNMKSHDQQTNLNDCIDNGHLMMNQMIKNTSFRRQLQNLTISNINSKTSNTSVNSSLMAYDNLILPQCNNQEKEEFVSYRAITMRKQSRPSEDLPSTSDYVLGKEVKKSRKSLVITKRKESANDILSYGQVMLYSQKQKISYDPKKHKSTTTSGSKIVSKKPSNGNKEVIKRMLDELNRKFAYDDKVIKISLSDKKQTSNAKKQKSESSGQNIQRNKIRSEIVPVASFNEKIVKKQTDRKSAQKQSYIIDLTDKKKSQKKVFYQEKKKNKGKNSENCFMSVTLNKTLNNGQVSNEQKNNIDNGKLIEQRTKQSHSEMSKKSLNAKCPSQNSQQNEICKILSKYRTKKPSIPECCMKIDLVTSKVNKVLSLAQKNSKQRNKIFFNNNNNLDKMDDYKLQISSNDSIGEPNLEVSKTYSKPSDDSYMIRRNSFNNFSSQTDNVMGEYVSMLPSNIYLQENQQEADCAPYKVQKPAVGNNSLDASQCFFTGSKTRLSSKPNSVNSSMDKKRASFDRNLEEWDMMFEKQKSKFLKNYNKITKKKSTLNEQVISEIKNKIEQCLILNHKDTNSSKSPYLQLKKGSQEKNVLQQKNTVMSANNTVKMLSSSNSNRNSIKRLQTTNKLGKRIEI